MLWIRSLMAIASVSSLTGVGLTAITAPPVRAQVPTAVVRALNLARTTAVAENGGLGVYRPQPCMFETDTGGGDCLIQNNTEGFTYRFQGGRPGWPYDDSNATTETEILIAPDGRSVKGVIYNRTLP